MDPAAFVKLATIGSIMLLVLSIGLSAPPRSVRDGLSRPAEVGRAMLSMFVLFPAFALGAVFLLPVEQSARTALLALAVSPMPPILSIKEQKAGAPLDYALAIQVAASVVALGAAPLMAFAGHALVGRSVTFEGVAMWRTILLTVILPLMGGIGFAALAPALAARLVRPIRLTGLVMLLVLVVVLLAKLGPAILSVATPATLAAILAMQIAGLAIGHAVAGPPIGHRHALALSTALRHPGVAIGLATAASFVEDQRVIGVVLLYLLITVPVSALYVRRARAAAAQG